MSVIAVRHETDVDLDDVRHVNRLAFGRQDEADLVDALREAGAAVLSLVAVRDDEVVGHVLFTEVRLVSEAGEESTGVGLGPMAVAPSHQRQGIGAALVERGLKECERLGYGWAVVLGHSGYYPRFGFEPAGPRGLRSEWDVPADVFMARELIPDALTGKTGTVRYRPEFGSV